MPPTFAGLILAAGASSRMGRPKALLPIGAETFVSRIAATMLRGGASRIVVVVSRPSMDIRAALAASPCGAQSTIVENPRPEDGQLSSLIAGLNALEDLDEAGALVCPVDIPLFTAATVAALIDVARSTAAAIVRPASGERHGHPVLFTQRTFVDFMRADLAGGARTVVRAYAADTVNVTVDDPGAFIDIDTLEEYRRWIGEATEGG